MRLRCAKTALNFIEQRLCQLWFTRHIRAMKRAVVKKPFDKWVRLSEVLSDQSDFVRHILQ